MGSKFKQSWNDVYQPVVACLGFPIEGNPSQFVLERLASQLSPEWRFVTLPVAPTDFATALSGVRVMNFAGVVVLPPHEKHAVAACDHLTDVAKATSSVRALRRSDATMEGHDTFWAALQRHLINSETGKPCKWTQLSDNSVPDAICKLNRSLAEARGTLEELENTEDPIVVLVDAQEHARVPKRLIRRPFGAGSKIILLKEHVNNQTWEDFGAQAGLELVRPIDLLVAHYVEVFMYLTGCQAPESFVREALEEYWGL